jgi:HAD superfamily hydrolase (TIGR01662 family)
MKGWPPTARVRALLCDRDATLIEDVPYNGDPARVRPLPTVREALDEARRRGLRVGMVTNQSGVARGLLTPWEVERVNERVEELLGPFDVVETCPHVDADRCRCRKPAPGMVLAAATRLRVAPEECVVIGDCGADVEAGVAAGASAILVPSVATSCKEIVEAGRSADCFGSAVTLALEYA